MNRIFCYIFLLRIKKRKCIFNEIVGKEKEDRKCRMKERLLDRQLQKDGNRYDRKSDVERKKKESKRKKDNVIVEHNDCKIR